MKSSNAFIHFLLFCMLSIACENDFLDRAPLDAPTEQSYFTKTNDLKSYMNGLYDAVLRNVGGYRFVYLANGSDDLINTEPHSSLNTRNISGLASETNGAWNTAYTNIRNVNYFLVKAYQVTPLDAAARHYIGEGYFTRAFVYFELLKTFGGVPFIDKPLLEDSEELYKPRDSRDLIAERIISDLDSAIANLDWKNAGEAGRARINKEAALILKSRVGLFEGSWELYHGQKGSPFAVEGKNGTEFLNAAVEAGEMLIARHGPNIYIGSEGREYQQLFVLPDYKDIDGAFFYKSYDPAYSVSHRWYLIGVSGVGAGLTKSLVDQYLMKDGKPVSISSIGMDETSMNSLAENKDPRLGQTMWYPAKGTFREAFPNSIGQHNYSTSMPGLITNQQRLPTLTGYRLWKGIRLVSPPAPDTDDTDDLMMRYAEGMLNYAEARSLLGSITQEDLDKTVNVLRDRVGMPHMILSEVNTWNIEYDPKDGYEIGVANIINEIRRERRIELALEGFRTDDIRRWALMEDVFNGYKPKGAHLQQFLDYWNDPDAMAKDGFQWKPAEQVRLTRGVNVESFDDGFINPFWRFPDFNASGQGYYIDPGRDYLESIPKQEISLYKSRHDVELEQNPGWF